MLHHCKHIAGLALVLVAWLLASCETRRQTATPPSPEQPSALAAPDLLARPITIAHWNILNLGRTTPVAERAAVVAQYDVVALTEVEHLDGLDRLHRAVEALTPAITWQVERTPQPVGDGKAAEYYAFVYRTDRVRAADGPRGIYQEQTASDFAREPFFATFRAGNFDFTLVVVHITWGNGGTDITEEVRRLDRVYQQVQDLSRSENDVILLGDFNTDGPGKRSFDALRSTGLQALVPLHTNGHPTKTTYSTKPGTVWASFYDNLWILPTATGQPGREWTGQAGVDPIHERFYQGDHLHVRTKVSDHAPVWASFYTHLQDDD